MPVSVLRRSGARGASLRKVRSDAEKILSFLDEKDSELSVLLATDSQIRRLNRDYRNKDRTTDVLAFAMREGDRIDGDESVLGDVVISLDTAKGQAVADGQSIDVAVRRLLIHGILHILGYDHERSLAEAKEMRRMEKNIGKQLD